MRHAAWTFCGLLLLVSGGLLLPLGAAAWAKEAPPAEDAAAAEEAPAPAPVHVPLDKWDDAHSMLRPKITAVYWVKLFLIWLLYLIFVKSRDWINRDSQIFDTGYGTWN